MNIVAKRRVAKMINFVLGFLTVCVALMIPTILLLMRTIDTLQLRIKSLEVDNKLLRDVRIWNVEEETKTQK